MFKTIHTLLCKHEILNIFGSRTISLLLSCHKWILTCCIIHDKAMANQMRRVCIFQYCRCVWQDAKGYRYHCWDLEDLYLSPQRQIYLIWQFNPLRDVLTVIKERTWAFKVSLRGLPSSSALTLNRKHNPTSWLFYPSQLTLECNLEEIRFKYAFLDSLCVNVLSKMIFYRLM